MNIASKKITVIAVAAVVLVGAFMWETRTPVIIVEVGSKEGERFFDERFGFSFICPTGTAVARFDMGAECSGIDGGMGISSVSVQLTAAKSVTEWLDSDMRVHLAGERVMGKKTVDGLEGVLVYAWTDEQISSDERAAQKYWHALREGKIYSIAYHSYALGFDDFLASVRFGE